MHSNTQPHQHTLREWQQMFKPTTDLIVQASKTDGSDGAQPFPIGMQYQYMNNHHKNASIQIGHHNQTVLFCINPHTDQQRRPHPHHQPNRIAITHHLEQNQIHNETFAPDTYFDILPQYKFVISPEGNGIDCHRHYEALIAGCIPVIEDNPKIRDKYKDCPILYTHNYSEITIPYLEEKYAEMLDQTYDFAPLFLSTYTDQEQEEIKKCGNYWTQTTTNQDFYPPSPRPTQNNPVGQTICVVFVTNKLYFDKFIQTATQLVTNGDYKDDICLIIGDDLHEDPELLNHHNTFLTKYNIQIKYFPTHQFTSEFLDIQQSLHRPQFWNDKRFQYHKLHLFNAFFKQWDYIFYIDAGTIIFQGIAPILNEKTPHTLLAHSDAYPNNKQTLYDQFEQPPTSPTTHTHNTPHNIFAKLQANFPTLNKTDYPQTTIMLYDTQIITPTTYTELVNLLHEYPISNTNDQGIIALYFTSIRPVWKQIKTNNNYTHFYDFLPRDPANNYIMLKRLG
jgi:hypothetical protein